MPYAFEAGEKLSAAIPRLMLEQIERVAGHLSNPEETPEKRVHNARKRIKETRAVLRLVRGALGKESFAIENRWYRDAARELASARDAQAVIEALDKLEIPARAKKHARKVLEARKKSIGAENLQQKIDGTVGRLDDARNRIAAWPPLPEDFDTIADGLGTIYREGRAAMKVAHGERTPHNLHEWRKRVKDHWYHLQLLRPVWPEMLKANAQALAALSEHLGDHHDLHVLDELTDSFGPHANVVREAITARLAELEASAFALGARIYAEKPRAWIARIETYWDAWRE